MTEKIEEKFRELAEAEGFKAHALRHTIEGRPILIISVYKKDQKHSGCTAINIYKPRLERVEMIFKQLEEAHLNKYGEA